MAVTRHSVIGSVEGGARATSVKQINAWRQITKRVSRLIATATASSFISPKSQSGSADIHPGLSVLLMRVGQSLKHSPPFPFFIFNETRFRGGHFSVSLAVQNWHYFPVFSARPCSCNCICAQRVIWCSAAGEWRVHSRIGVGLNSPIPCKDYASTSLIGRAQLKPQIQLHCHEVSQRFVQWKH